MGRNSETCRLCSSTAKGRITIQWCKVCLGRFCEKHIVWDNGSDQWVCKRCARTVAAKQAA